VQVQREGEGIELQAFQPGRRGGVLLQLLVGDAQGRAGENEKADQGIERQEDAYAIGQTHRGSRHGQRRSTVRSASMAKPRRFAGGCAHHSCRISVLSGGSPPGEGKSPAGGRYWQSRTGRPLFSAQRSTWLRQSSSDTLARLLLHTSVPPSAVTRSAGLSRLW